PRRCTRRRCEALGDASPAADDPLLFDGGLLGGGPRLQWLALDRVLRVGERPDAVVMEFWPPLFADGAWCHEENRIAANRLSRIDLALVSRHAADSDRVRAAWWTARRVPAYGQRFVARRLPVPP